MKIQNINNWNNQPNATKNIKASDNSFEHVLKSRVNNDKPVENVLPRSHFIANAEQIDSVRPLSLQNMRQIDSTGLESLVKDAFSDISKQILRDIDSMCSDETGECIDMKLLNDLLELYKESR